MLGSERDQAMQSYPLPVDQMFRLNERRCGTREEVRLAVHQERVPCVRRGLDPEKFLEEREAEGAFGPLSLLDVEEDQS